MQWKTLIRSADQKLDVVGNLLTSIFKRIQVVFGCWVHIGTMGCSLNVKGSTAGVREVGHSKSMPRVDRSVR